MLKRLMLSQNFSCRVAKPTRTKRFGVILWHGVMPMMQMPRGVTGDDLDFLPCPAKECQPGGNLKHCLVEL
jgi:hypothetical protein